MHNITPQPYNQAYKILLQKFILIWLEQELSVIMHPKLTTALT
jgi:hypothetical protein